MVGLDDFLTQFLQPYFFYSLVFLSIAYVCTAIFLKFNTFMSRRYQSIISFMPLLVPVFVLLMFRPEMSISALFPPQNLLLPSVASSAELSFLESYPQYLQHFVNHWLTLFWRNNYRRWLSCGYGCFRQEDRDEALGCFPNEPR